MKKITTTLFFAKQLGFLAKHNRDVDDRHTFFFFCVAEAGNNGKSVIRWGKNLKLDVLSNLIL